MDNLILSNKEGRPYPLGASFSDGYVNFAVYAGATGSCRIKLFREKEKEPFACLDMHRSSYHEIFTIEVKVAEDCFEYLFVTDNDEFVDKYAKRVSGREVFGRLPGKGDSVRGCVGVSEFEWGGDKAPHIQYSDMIIYKLHVRGYTMHESSKVKHKGTFLGVTEKIKDMTRLGINAVLLMPCIEFNELIDHSYQIGLKKDSAMSAFYGWRNRISNRDKEKRMSAETVSFGRVNYWGYGTSANYYAPKSSYASNPREVCSEFKSMVKKLHEANIEVLMEMDFTGETDICFIIDCLRYWVLEYHIDGFRLSAGEMISELIAADVYLSSSKLIGTNWETSRIYTDDRQPSVKRLAACNDGFEIDMRRFLKGDEGQVSNVTERFRENRELVAGINYISEHNGFTLNDIYCYDVKHNEANEENNRDGREINYSWNCGAEGSTRKKKVLELRKKMVKNALTLLLLSQGTPMLMAGDECGNSQNGNNNAYCCDNETGWVNWNNGRYGQELRKFITELIKLRKQHTAFHNNNLLRGQDYISCGVPDISFHGTKAWLPDYGYYSRTIGIMLGGKYAIIQRDKTDSSFYFMINMHWESHEFDLPDALDGEWQLLLSTEEKGTERLQERKYRVPPRSIVIFECKG